MRRRRPGWAAAVIGLVGLLITTAVASAAWTIDRSNEHGLLTVQTKQAADLISAAIVSISYPLQSGLDVASASAGDPAQFRRFMAGHTGPGAQFVSAALWRADGAAPTPVAAVGSEPALAAASTSAQAFIRRAVASPTFVVMSITDAGVHRIGYALADPGNSAYVVYAERVIPENRRVPVESNPAFADLRFATYLGPTTDASALQTTDVPLDELPLSGATARETIPFGDSTVTLVTAPRVHLGGELAGQLPWIFLAGGVLLTAGAALIGSQLVKSRADAEHNARTITGLYEQLDRLYAEQRSIAETLQHALIPATNPAIPHLESASRYVAGAHGVDIGGDWYSLILVDDTHFAFVVGDVSGRGVEAAAIMARIRFTVRAYLLEGHSPEVALAMCSGQLDINQDGHLATVLVGKGDLASRQVTLANAGHLSPLMVSGDESQFVPTNVGLPLGIGRTAYQPTTFTMPPGSMLLAFTDGLVERRTEPLSVGLQRLADRVRPADRPLEDLLTAVLRDLTGEHPDDDTAMLAFRWVGSGGSA